MIFLQFVLEALVKIVGSTIHIFYSIFNFVFSSMGEGFKQIFLYSNVVRLCLQFFLIIAATISEKIERNNIFCQTP
jgi:hypothetical protein